MYQFNLNYIWSNWVGPTQLQFIQWIIFLSVGYWSLSSRNDPIFFCSLHWRNLSLYNKITTTHFKQIRFWCKNVIKFRGKVYSNFFKFVQQLFFLSAYTLSPYALYSENRDSSVKRTPLWSASSNVSICPLKSVTMTNCSQVETPMRTTSMQMSRRRLRKPLQVFWVD